MNVVGTNGMEYTWNLSKYANNQRANASAGHVKARLLLKEMFPFDRTLEELTLPGTRPNLYADFFIFAQMLMVEVQGRQHYEFIPFFHKTKLAFYKAQARDKQKRSWCVTNDITLLCLNDKDSIDEWRYQISKR